MMRAKFVISCLVVFVLITRESHSDNILSFGNVATSSDSLSTFRPDVVGTSFLLYEINSTATLFAVSGYFTAATNLSFQVWRPLGKADDIGLRRFKLIWQMAATPSVAYFREDIYMEAKFASSCALVRPGDWFGMVSLTAPFSIGVKFFAMAPIVPKINGAIPGSNQVVGTEANFEVTFQYPYQFQLAAYLSTDLSRLAGVNVSAVETVPCPTRLMVPSWINAIPMVTFAPGAAGATGATGQQGPNGAIGPPGQMGSPGQIGNIGNTGSSGGTGATGPIGAAGQVGPVGPKGMKGVQGPTGIRGDMGDAGRPGQQGRPGNNTYQYNAQPPQPMSYQSTEGDSLTDGGLADRPELRMGAIIWLALLSALVVVCSTVLVFVCYFVADDRRIQKNETSWIETESKKRF